LEEIRDAAARPGYVRLKAGGCVLSVQSASAVGKEQEPIGGVELQFEAADVETIKAIVESLKARGAEIIEANEMAWGTAVDARDLDGHRISIYKRNRE
jgi:uncharacterized glyoxalase superfamily protein PhnB